MMSKLMRRVEEIARSLRQRKIEAVADRLKAMLDSAVVEIEQSRVVVGGRGILKRWLIDPGLRFLTDLLK